MKKKLNGVIAFLLSLACIPVIPLNANASPETRKIFDIAYHSYDDYTLETEKFSYSRRGLLMKESIGANFLVTGVFRQNNGKIQGYTVLQIGAEDDCRGWLNGVGEIDGRELQVGDIIGSTEGSEWMTSASIPETYTPYNDPEYGHFCTPTYIGNGVDLLGEEFKNVIRHELVTEWDFYNLVGDVSNVEITNGDATADGKTGIADVLAVNQSLLGVHTLSNYGVLAADVNHNGTVEDADALKILKSLVGLETLE
ncbi:MAG: dockerin type I repeat-containing protein [Oscillospiraceae bacterium]